MGAIVEEAAQERSFMIRSSMGNKRMNLIRSGTRRFGRSIKRASQRITQESTRQISSTPQTTSSMPDPASHTKNRKRTTFFDLSAELRNRIYEEVLHSLPRDVDITYQPPTLLAINRQIRAETRPMWYGLTDFIWTIRSCDIRLALQWNQLMRGVARVKPLTLRFDRVCGWANLMWWCWAVQQSRMMPLSGSPGSTLGAYSQVIAAATAVALSHAGGSWNKCKAALTAMRGTFGLVDAERLKGEDGFEMCK